MTYTLGEMVADLEKLRERAYQTDNAHLVPSIQVVIMRLNEEIVRRGLDRLHA